MKALIVIDMLNDFYTGVLANRQHAEKIVPQLQQLLAHARSSKDWVVVYSNDAHLDVDFFKLYNDTYGHAEGDGCLRAIADVLRKTLARKDDVVARLGGEEFAIVLPGAGNKAAMRMAERLLMAVRAMKRQHAASPLGHVTVSIGVAVGVPATDFSYAHLLQRADRALYLCKGSGKDCASLNPGLV